MKSSFRDTEFEAYLSFIWKSWTTLFKFKHKNQKRSIVYA